VARFTIPCRLQAIVEKAKTPAWVSEQLAAFTRKLDDARKALAALEACLCRG
jgi:hypothetical protein